MSTQICGELMSVFICIKLITCTAIVYKVTPRGSILAILDNFNSVEVFECNLSMIHENESFINEVSYICYEFISL